ncbi:hypothetical protein ACH3XW_24060 [Acanthocheilonema viteae]
MDLRWTTLSSVDINRLFRYLQIYHFSCLLFKSLLIVQDLLINASILFVSQLNCVSLCNITTNESMAYFTFSKKNHYVFAYVYSNRGKRMK